MRIKIANVAQRKPTTYTYLLATYKLLMTNPRLNVRN